MNVSFFCAFVLVSSRVFEMMMFVTSFVIEQTIRQKLPEGFQRSEFLLDHGLIDQVVHRSDLRTTIHQLLCLLKNEPLSPAEVEKK